jgi:hypothetical protein
MLNTDGKFRWYDNEWAYSCRVVDLAEFIVRGADVVESLITKGLEATQSAFNS